MSSITISKSRLFERGLRTVSRFNILNGVLAYVSSPLWLLSLVLGVLLALQGDSASTKPSLVGPILAIPLSRITASTELGLAAKAKGWFVIPEETVPPDELVEVEESFTSPPNPFFTTKEYAPDYGLLQAVLDPYLNAIHVSLLRLRTENSPRTKENLALLADRLLLDGPFALTPAEKRTLLWDAETMLAMHQKLWSSPASHLHDWWQAAFRHYVESTALSIRRTVNA